MKKSKFSVLLIILIIWTNVLSCYGDGGQTVITGDINTTVLSFTVPAAISFEINPNTGEVITPEFSITNTCTAPINVNISGFTEALDSNSVFEEVEPEAYTEEQWGRLDKSDSSNFLAPFISIVDVNQWAFLNENKVSAKTVQNGSSRIGILNPGSSATFKIDVKHGNSFEEAKIVSYNLIFTFELAKKEFNGVEPYLSSLSVTRSDGVEVPLTSSESDGKITASSGIVASNFSSVNINPVYDPALTVKYGGTTIDSGTNLVVGGLDFGNNYITLDIINTLGESTEYTVLINREHSTYLSNLVPVVGTMQVFVPTTFSYKLKTGGASTTYLVPTKEDWTSIITMVIGGKTYVVESNTQSPPIIIGLLSVVVTITVTSFSGIPSKTYTVTVSKF